MSEEKEEYDNRNQGALIEPYESMEFMLQGDINVDGLEFKGAVIADTLRDGRTILHVYQRVGALFKGRSDKEGAPDYTGNIFDDKNLSAWKNISKKGNPYLKVRIEERLQQEQSQNSNTHKQSNDMDDEVPF
tara:strand:+ start:781 stop:1176 length:396 start_codon:yes stop_codon:yes gene_type:complete